MRVDFARRVVERGGQHVHLTPWNTGCWRPCWRTAAAGHDAPRATARRVGPSHVESVHYLRIYMGHLRQKLEVDPAQPVYLLTEIGVGYRYAG